MEIVNKNFEETAYRVDVLAEAVEYVDWTRNAVKVAVPRETVFERQARNIRALSSCVGVTFGNEQRREKFG